MNQTEHEREAPPNVAIERNRATFRGNRPMKRPMGASQSSSARARRRGRGDGGAALVEFALIMPLLFLLIFGIIEFGWAFYQTSDVRHGARETARLAAVNFNPDAETDGDNQASDIIAAGCERMDEDTNSTIAISLPEGDLLGDKAVVTVSKPLDTLTGFLDTFLPSDLDDTIEIRLEQNADWNARTQAC
jgi:Flp pilus assembly protein TadG